MSPSNGDDAELPTEIAAWCDRTRIFLRPIAAPSILGLFGFAGATFVVAAYLAGWYGDKTTPEYLFPFAAAFGGVAQFSAAMWAYIARDGLATAMHGMWGSFWLAFGVLFLLMAIGTINLETPAAFDALGFWFFALAGITAIGAAAAVFENAALTTVLALLTVGAAFLGIGYYTEAAPTAGAGWIEAGGWVLLGSAAAAAYTAGAMMLEGAAGRVVVPLGKYTREANRPGQRITSAIELERGEVGVRQGQ